MPRKARGRLIKNCEWCGNPIGAERGPAAKTCSPECSLDRNSARERVRYGRVKDTQAWKATRADYLERLRERLAADPEFARRIAQGRREAARRYHVKLNPEQLEAYRAQRRAWHRNLAPERRAERKYWYGTLSPQLKALFLLELREKRALARLKEASQILDTRTKWDKSNDHLLGTMSDGKLARQLGVQQQVVTYHRRRLGIAPTTSNVAPQLSDDDSTGHNHSLSDPRQQGMSASASQRNTRQIRKVTCIVSETGK